MVVGDANVSAQIYDNMWCEPTGVLGRTLKVTNSPLWIEKVSPCTRTRHFSFLVVSPSDSASLLDLIVFPH